VATSVYVDGLEGSWFVGSMKGLWFARPKGSFGSAGCCCVDKEGWRKEG
jgi:hypothetical protein